MRLRNVKNAQDKIDSCSYMIKKEDYPACFSNNQPLEIEIGCGKGDFIIEKAKQNPHINYIGIEKYASVLVSVVKKLENQTLNNLKFLCMDAKEIQEVFFHSVEKIYLNFSDPWPKAKHAKRRLTSKEFLSLYDNTFKHEPMIEMKTDNVLLFTYSIESLSDYGYTLKQVTFDLQEEDNIQTEYEKKFRKLGLPIYKLVAIHKRNVK